MGLAMKSGMLSIATSSRNGASRRRRSAENPDTQQPAEAGQDRRHLKSVDSEEGESETSDAEIEAGAPGGAPLDVAGLPIEASPESEGNAPAAAATPGLESAPTD